MSATSPPDWSKAFAPTLEEFETLAEAAFAKLPEAFRAQCKGLLIRVEDFAEDDALTGLGMDSPFDLMGLYQGVSIAAGPPLEYPRKGNAETDAG